MGAMLRREEHGAGADLGLLALRLTVGGLLMGHGSQKLFGWFDGPGLEGFGGFLESMGYKPGKQWATMAGLSEFGGGALTALGLFHPIGPIATLGAMAVASVSVHGGKPVWASEGGPELPIINMASATALALIGPGQFSLDNAFGIRLPKEVALAATLAVAAGVVMAETKPQALADVSDAVAGAAEDVQSQVGEAGERGGIGDGIAQPQAGEGQGEAAPGTSL